MRRALFAFASGALFAIGLGLAGMTDPRKVLAFLDVRGDWDPSLLVVMGAAVLVHGAAILLGARRTFAPPERLDARLLGGAAIFGVGWGLAGYCPGPAVVALVRLAPSSIVFASAMVAGMLLHARVLPREDDASPTCADPALGLERR